MIPLVIWKNCAQSFSKIGIALPFFENITGLQKRYTNYSMSFKELGLVSLLGFGISPTGLLLSRGRLSIFSDDVTSPPLFEKPRSGYWFFTKTGSP